jgi:hypothetical protein
MDTTQLNALRLGSDRLVTTTLKCFSISIKATNLSVMQTSGVLTGSQLYSCVYRKLHIMVYYYGT